MTGSNTGANTIDGSLVNSGGGGALAIAKTGTGSWILAGSNSYTGGTVVSQGSLSFAANNAFPQDTSLNISSGAIAVAADHGTNPKNNLITSSLSLGTTGKLDLNNNDLLVQNGTLATISAAVGQGFAHGSWTGTGIASTSAANNTAHLMALGTIQNSADGTTTGSTLYPNFDGISNGASTDVLVKYTYYGDANLDGMVDGSDYSRIDAAFVADQSAPGSYTGWFNG